MESVQDRLNKELNMGKSIAWWAVGYYKTAGNQFSPSLKVPIFDWIEYSNFNTKVLIEFLGSMMWINVSPSQVHYGNGGEYSPSKEGKVLRLNLEAIMCNN